MKKIVFLSMCFFSITINAWSQSIPDGMCPLGVDCILHSGSLLSGNEIALVGYPLETGEYTCHIAQKYSKHDIELCIGTHAGQAYWRREECFDLQKNPSGQDIDRSFPFFAKDGYFEFSAAGTSWFDRNSWFGGAEIIANCRKVTT